jgi:ribosome biogenesis GTPase A
MSVPPVGTSPLRDYVAAKHEVATLVTEALDLLREHRPESAVVAEELIVKLAEDRFNLAVVGQFKRGKSTLMNAVIGRDLLPTGILPLTSVITAVCYGPRVGVWLRRRGSTFEQEIRTDQLADYVTELGNPGNEKGLTEVRVELPLAFLRRGLYFIDTPGVGSASRENTETAYRFLPDADAVIFVTSVDRPLGEDEQRFLKDIGDQASSLMVVVNKIDLVESDEREEVLAYIADRIAETVGSDDVPQFPISARAALDAKLRGDHAAEQRSGLPEFEAALSDFLANEQGRTFLVRILDRTIDLVEPVVGSAPGAGGTAGHSSVLERAIAVRDRLLGTGLAAAADADDETVEDLVVLEDAVRSPGRREGPRPRRHTPTSGCPICATQSQAIFQFFAQWQHQLATDRRAQRAFAAAGGFCPGHTWQFQQLAAPQDLSVGYAPLVELLQRDVARAAAEPPLVAASRLKDRLSSSEHCPACRVLRDTERSSLLEHLARIAAGGESGQAALEAGWCLAHLRAALQTDLGPATARRLLEEQAEQLEVTLEDMRSYSLKRTAVRRGIINTREAEAWRRALVQLVGERAARGVVLGDDDASWGA